MEKKKKWPATSHKDYITFFMKIQHNYFELMMLAEHPNMQSKLLLSLLLAIYY